MFDTIQWYLPSTAQWQDLAGYANAAAFDRYARCRETGYDAFAEQDAVDKAIGYPRLTPPDAC